MRRHVAPVASLLLMASLLLAVLLAAPASPAERRRRPVVTGAVQVTDNPVPVRAHNSPQLARNPKTGELVVAEVDSFGSRECTVHISVDDGRSWFRGGNPMMRPFTDCSIGAEWGNYFGLFFGRNGVLYLPFAANDPKELAQTRPVTTEDTRDFIPRHVFLASSTDGGRSFSTTIVHRVSEGHPDRYNKGVVGAVDPNDPQRVYVGWRQGAFSSETQKLKNLVAASTDGGKTFAAPVDITDDRGADHPWLAVGRDGTVHAVTWSRSFGLGDESPPRPIFHLRSRDQGKTWTRKEIDPGNERSYRPPVFAADPRSDSLYVAWFGSAEEHNRALEDKDRTDIFLRASTDGGKTWSAQRTVNDDAGKGINHEFPGIAIGPEGRVDVAWYDGRLSPRPSSDPESDSGLQDVFYASSTNQGRSFGPNRRITDRSIDRSIGVWSNNIGSAAPIGMASAADAVYFAWQDTRNGNPLTNAEDVYFASLRLAEPLASGSGMPPWITLAPSSALWQERQLATDGRRDVSAG
ncbi:MAG: hypothetical protein ACRDJ4_15065, partial [Actinomycetota bacterium]